MTDRYTIVTVEELGLPHLVGKDFDEKTILEIVNYIYKKGLEFVDFVNIGGVVKILIKNYD